MTLEQSLAIYSLLCRYNPPPKRIVEIGTYCGTGAILLAAMVEPWGGHVTTIDLPWVGSPNQYFEKTVDDWLKETGTNNVTVVRREDGAEGWFLDFFKRHEAPLDFIYIDGGHQWVHTAAQFSIAYAALKRGGWLCFDDLHVEAWPDVQACWENIVCRIVPEVHRHEIGRQGFCMR